MADWPLMINRREFLGLTAGAGAALALTPELLGALRKSSGKRGPSSSSSTSSAIRPSPWSARGTSQSKHMLDNIAAGIGRLPNEATRKRMAELVDAWPQAARAGG